MANDIQVTNVSLVNTDLGQGITHVAFDIGWQNSWRGGGVGNWDAAWVFVKYKLHTGIWQHAYPQLFGHVAPPGSLIEPGLLSPGSLHSATTNPVIGVFIRRDTDGSGTFQADGARLRWNYGQLGLAINDIIEVQVFAIEMVYVNEGAFAVGSSGGFATTTITTANAATTPSGTGSLGGLAGGHPTGNSPNGNSDYPNGFSAFYCMKYEMSQQQYVDFLNTLTRLQQDFRTQTNIFPGVFGVPNSYAMSNSGSVQHRNGIRCSTPIPVNDPVTFHCDGNGNFTGGESDDGQWLACNYLNWADLGAYLSWSGLRPMSEMEFEKACRGPLPPVTGEYAWGTTAIANISYGISGHRTANEAISQNYFQSRGQALYSATSAVLAGPGRTGIFAAHPSNIGRLTSGSSYYGIMELSGNIYESTVMIGTSGSNYTGAHGNGTLDGQGRHNSALLLWPNELGSGIIIRGGSFETSAQSMRVGDRLSEIVSGNGTRTNVTGGRGVRTAP